MPNRTYRVRVLFPETPERKKHVESQAHGFALQALTADAAAREARARIIANGFVVRSLSHSPGDVIYVSAINPKQMPVRP